MIVNPYESPPPYETEDDENLGWWVAVTIVTGWVAAWFLFVSFIQVMLPS